MNLTPKQLAIAKFVVRYRDEKGLCPTLEEIAEALEVSKITVYEHVAQLERKGAVTKEKYRSRSITVLPELEEELRRRMAEDASAQPGGGASGGHGGGKSLTLPLMGIIAAGQPIEAVLDGEGLDLGSLARTERAAYVLKVRGQSMIDEGIRSGDYVLVENRSWASNGELVVAVLDGSEATLKRFHKEGNRIRLQPANVEMEPILVDAARCEVRGVVVGLVRRY